MYVSFKKLKVTMLGMAYRTTELVVQALTNLSRARVRLHNTEVIPEAPVIFVINHFTRLETILLPYLIHKLTHTPVRVLAAAEFFQEPFGKLLVHLGAVSTQDPDRDRLIIKTLLKADTHWIIFPEGGMVKSKKIMEGRQFIVTLDGIKRPPHTGPGTLGFRAEFYRARLRNCCAHYPDECSRLLKYFELDALPERIVKDTKIVPVNISYYPVRARENVLIEIARRFGSELPERLIEELMTEGSMLLSGVDVDIRFGESIPLAESLCRLTSSEVLSGSASVDFNSALIPRNVVRRESTRLMHRYMSSIYQLTTVNPDHLLASLLRSSPFRRVMRDDLARRLYLVAVDLRGSEVHLHPDLTSNLLHVLSDDPKGIIQNFLDLAVEKGNLITEGTFFRKNSSSFSATCNFHRARVDNPLDGMANAIVPLFRVRRSVRLISLCPVTVVRWIIRRRLIREGVEEFREDYRSFCVPGETKSPEVGMPFIVRGRSCRMGVVLAHGYMAAPLEVRGLAEYLGSRGFWVYVPRLRGHGTSPEDLAKRSYEDWAISVARGYAIMKATCQRVIAGGFSTGGGLALNLASRVNDLAGVFSISAPMRLRDFSSRFAPALNAWNRIMDAAGSLSAKMPYVENKPENPHINYLRNPISGVRELARLMTKLDGRLSTVRTPALIIQSERDPVVDPRGSERIFNRLGSPDKTRVIFNFDRHGILLGENSQAVYRTVGEFVERLSIQ